MTSSDEIVVRRATAADQPAVLALLADSLGWTRDASFAEFFEWKHLRNPFGQSPAWVAVAGGETVGFRTFLRWQFEHPDGRTRRAVRAVDTATAPAHQGQGIFRKLTLAAIEEVTADTDFVFNTPNDNSRPGYLRMGWSTVGRMPLVVRVAGVRGALRMRSSRVPADRRPVETIAGHDAATVLADPRLDGLLSAIGPPTGLRTVRSPEYLQWRYGLAALGYRAIALDDDPTAGLVVFRMRRRGDAVEAGVSELLVPRRDNAAARRLLRAIKRQAGADYSIQLGAPTGARLRSGYVPLPRQGPILTWRPLRDDSAPPAVGDLDFSLGDVELL